MAPFSIRNLALGVGDHVLWASDAAYKYRGVLQVVARRRGAGVNFPDLAGLCKNENVWLPKPPSGKTDWHFVLNTLHASGLVHKRAAYVTTEKGKQTATFIVYLRAYAPRGATAAEVFVCTDEKLKILVKAYHTRLEEAKGPETQGAVLMHELKQTLCATLRTAEFGWSKDKVEHADHAEKIKRLASRVKDKLVADGTAKVIDAVVGHVGSRPKTKQALQLCSEGDAPALAPAGRSATADDDEDADEDDDHDKTELDFSSNARTDARNTRGGGALELESRVEVQLAAMCDVAGAEGVNVSAAAKLFEYGGKEFGKRCDNMADPTKRAMGLNAFPVTQVSRQIGKYKNKFLLCVGSDRVHGKNDVTGTSNASAVLQNARGQIILDILSKRGYLFGQYIGRYVKNAENALALARNPNAKADWQRANPAKKPDAWHNPVDSQPMHRVLAPLLLRNDLRAIRVTKPNGSKEYDVYLDKTFPDPTEAMRAAIGAEIAATEKATKAPWWNGTDNEHIFDITEPKNWVAPPAAMTSGGLILQPILDEGAFTSWSWSKALTASAPKNQEDKTEKQKIPTQFLRNVAALTGGVVEAKATRMKKTHVFFASQVFTKSGANETQRALTHVLGTGNVLKSSDESTESHVVDLSVLFRTRAPIELSLQLFGIPSEVVRAESPQTVAALVALAKAGKTLGDLDDHQRRVVCGDPDSVQFKEHSKRLTLLVDALCSVELLRRVETFENDASVTRHALSRAAGYVNVLDQDKKETHRVCVPDGAEDYWTGIEHAFTAHDDPAPEHGKKPGKIDKPESAKTAYPNKQFIASQKAAGGTATRGFCYANIWNDTSAIPFATRVTLLDAFHAHRGDTYSVHLVTRAESSVASAETRARAAAKLSVLTPWVIDLPRLVTECGASLQSVRHLHDLDQMRVVSDLIADGSVTLDELTAAHPVDPRHGGYKANAARGEKKSTQNKRKAPVDKTPADGDADADEDGAEPTAKRTRNMWDLREDTTMLVAALRSFIFYPTLDARFHSIRKQLPRSPERCRKRCNILTTGKADGKDCDRVERGEEIHRVIAEFRNLIGGKITKWEENVRKWEDKLRREVDRILQTDFPVGTTDNYYGGPGRKPANAPEHGGGQVAKNGGGQKAGKGKKRPRKNASEVVSDSEDHVPIAHLGAFDSDSEDHVPIARMKPVKAKAKAKAKKQKRAPTPDSEEEVSDDNVPVAMLVSDSEDQSTSHEYAAEVVSVVPVAHPVVEMAPAQSIAVANALSRIIQALVRDAEGAVSGTAVQADSVQTAFDEAVSKLDTDVVANAISILKTAGAVEEVDDAGSVRLADAFRSATNDQSLGALVSVPGGSTSTVWGATAQAAHALMASAPLTPSTCVQPSVGQTLALLSAVAHSELRLDVAQLADGKDLPTAFGTHPEDEPENRDDLSRRVVVQVQGRRNSLSAIQGNDLGSGAWDAVRSKRAAEAIATATAAAKANPVDVQRATAAAINAGAAGITALELSQANLGSFSELACDIALKKASDSGALRAVNGYTKIRYVAPEHSSAMTFTAPGGEKETLGALPWRTSDGGVDETFLGGLKRSALNQCRTHPGITVDGLANKLSQALTPVAAVVLVELMLHRGELVLGATSEPAATGGFPPAMLMSRETALAAEAAAREAPQRHVYVPANCGAWVQ